MIFVTVGTHEQSFNRLVEVIDNLKEKGTIQEEVIIQTGFSTYEPRHCNWSKLFPYQEMVKNVADARIVITHGGPSSFIMPLQIGKIPVVVPRQKQFDEHINNHQVDFANEVANRQGNIIVVEHIESLEDTILRYEDIVQAMPTNIKSNNSKFCQNFEELVDGLMKNRM
ncbi:multidrug MFS transporter [Bacillus sp. ISL-40]|uniref:glycosyltransferase n=1 Tax=unclassified Bacillus (in: firmicutes) TaxID=185979 RepID=UPI001BEA7C51|nr:MULTISPECIES: glycosyltransferase [unclassified Bacillus (in: firmicutes)]MBT2701018.1 multidrug MFS transporter [Bacillus sp. ISL-40]MBT2739326.1 multidrug MFS transporter [Bacillus sp. ISL-77]